VLQLASRHRVIGLVHHALEKTAALGPPAVLDQIREEARQLLRKNLLLAAETIKLQRIFATSEIPALFLKGTPLAMLAYKSIGMRHSGDIDLLLPAQSILHAGNLLRKNGYEQRVPPEHFKTTQERMWSLRSKESVYVHKHTGVTAEVHTRLFDNARLLPVSSVVGRRWVQISHGFDVRTLDEEELFTYLCGHGAVHCWFRLKWLSDIHALLMQSDSVERLYKAADRRGLGRCAGQAILLCHRYFNLELERSFYESLTSQPTIRRLEDQATKALLAEEEPTEQFLGTLRNNLSHFLLKPDWSYKFSEVWDHLISPVDILTLPLPPSLAFLYPFLRVPLWTWRSAVKLLR
jgi:hypothetical protein